MVILMIFKDVVLTTEFNVLLNDMENDHENLGTGVYALSQHTTCSIKEDGVYRT
jgi:hypothetical protein